MQLTCDFGLTQQTIAVWESVQHTKPLIQCLTNNVVTQFTANVLLAGGASPAMVETSGEAPLFAEIASGVLINLGTLDPHQIEIMPQVAQAAHQAGTPWVLDPVAVGPLPVRTQLAVQLLDYSPTLIRGNASEILGLSKAAGGPGQSSGRGVDTGDDVDQAITAATYLASRYGSVVAVSGPFDLITDGQRQIRCANGDALLTLVTGGGCALGAYLAAFLAAGSNPLIAAAAGHGAYGLAAQKAAEHSEGPGSFAVHLLDELFTLTGEALETGVILW